jgi:phage terminase small subunit
MTTRKRGAALQAVAVPAEPEVPGTDPPSSLSPAAKVWWRGIVGSFELEPHHLLVLSEAARSWDRCQEAAALVNRDGVVVVDRFGQQRQHPAVQIERDSRAAFLKAMRELDIDGAPDADVRPPRASRNR